MNWPFFLSEKQQLRRALETEIKAGRRQSTRQESGFLYIGDGKLHSARFK